MCFIFRYHHKLRSPSLHPCLSVPASSTLHPWTGVGISGSTVGVWWQPRLQSCHRRCCHFSSGCQVGWVSSFIVLISNELSCLSIFIFVLTTAGSFCWSLGWAWCLYLTHWGTPAVRHLPWNHLVYRIWRAARPPSSSPQLVPWLWKCGRADYV